MIVLIGIAFLAGIVTAISPCVLPVLPIVLAGGASGGRRRPYAIVAGLLTTFVVSILFAAWLLRKLGLPQDLLRDISIALLFLVAATLLVPQLGIVLERALAPLGRRSGGDLGGGFLLGAALGFVFVPCGGPILAYVSAQAATVHFGFRTTALAVAYGLGAAVVLLAIALGGRRTARPLQARATRVRAGLGVIVAASAFALVFDLDVRLQTALPNWTNFLQEHTENTAYARKKLAKPRPEPELAAAGLPDYGAAADFAGISHWLNTPGERPLTLRSLRGKVVLVDFWTYSCVNCLRTLPHLRAWHHAYARAGLVIVGVHTPEFAFEHELGNVRGATKRLGVAWPVALDNRFGTWNAYQNQYWPAEYLIDASGHIRHAHFGEGEYDETERLIRTLLAERARSLPSAADVRDVTPHGLLTPESYLGYGRLDRFTGSPVRPDRFAEYRFPSVLPEDNLGYAGRWRVERERIVAGLGARLELAFVARKIYLVLGGRGTVEMLVNGKHERTLDIRGIARLYTLLDGEKIRHDVLELRFSPGVSAYAFTFG